MKSPHLRTSYGLAILIGLAFAGVACSSSDGGTSGSTTCPDLFTTAPSYAGNEEVAGCYYPGVYGVKATMKQTAGTCNGEFDWQATTSLAQAHTCVATISGDATSGYDVHFCTGQSFEGSLHFPPDLSTFTGSFTYSASCGAGTTTFKDIKKN